jgi:hypothetical protein
MRGEARENLKAEDIAKEGDVSVEKQQVILPSTHISMIK